MRGGLALTLVLVVLSGGYLFHTKHKVAQLEQELRKVHKSIENTEENLHLLQAEWTFLNDPQRLQVLAIKHLDLRPTEPTQLVARTQGGRLQRNDGRQNLKMVLASYRR